MEQFPKHLTFKYDELEDKVGTKAHLANMSLNFLVSNILRLPTQKGRNGMVMLERFVSPATHANLDQIQTAMRDFYAKTAPLPLPLEDVFLMTITYFKLHDQLHIGLRSKEDPLGNGPVVHGVLVTEVNKAMFDHIKYYVEQLTTKETRQGKKITVSARLQMRRQAHFKMGEAFTATLCLDGNLIPTQDISPEQALAMAKASGIDVGKIDPSRILSAMNLGEGKAIQQEDGSYVLNVDLPETAPPAEPTVH